MDRVDPRLLLILGALIVVEMLWARRRHNGAYNVKDSLSNMSIAVIGNIIKPVSLAWTYLLFESFVEPIQIVTLPETWPVFIATFVAADLAYYWYHRLNHEVTVLWTMHHTHHSSPWLNLTTAVRLNWVANFVSPAFFAPLVLVGFSAEWVTISLALGLFYQFFLHTEAVPRLGRFEGVLLNTPSAHRVHHGSNTAYIDKNYAGALIVWDRIFGTYQPEVEPVHYGVTTGFVGHNPFVIQLAPLWKYVRRDWRRERHIAAAQER